MCPALDLGLANEARKKGSIQSDNRVAGAHLTIALPSSRFGLPRQRRVAECKLSRERRRHIRAARGRVVLACVTWDWDLGGLGSWKWWEARSHGRSLRTREVTDMDGLLLTWLKHAGREIRHAGRDKDRLVMGVSAMIVTMREGR